MRAAKSSRRNSMSRQKNSVSERGRLKKGSVKREKVVAEVETIGGPAPAIVVLEMVAVILAEAVGVIVRSAQEVAAEKTAQVVTVGAIDVLLPTPVTKEVRPGLRHGEVREGRIVTRTKIGAGMRPDSRLLGTLAAMQAGKRRLRAKRKDGVQFESRRTNPSPHVRLHLRLLQMRMMDFRKFPKRRARPRSQPLRRMTRAGKQLLNRKRKRRSRMQPLLKRPRPRVLHGAKVRRVVGMTERNLEQRHHGRKTGREMTEVQPPLQPVETRGKAKAGTKHSAKHRGEEEQLEEAEAEEERVTVTIGAAECVGPSLKAS